LQDKKAWEELSRMSGSMALWREMSSTGEIN
jgi:hypothetical protein